MAFPILSRARQRPVQLPAAELAAKAVAVAIKPGSLKELPEGERPQVDELVKALSVGSGYAKPPRFRRGPDPKPQSAAVVAARAHAVLGPSSNVMPVEIAVALQEQGLDMVEPFAPGSPLQPYYGYGRRPRTHNFETARNTTTNTREGRMPFETLERLYESYDIAQTCTRYSINDLRSMRVRFQAMDGYGQNPVKEINEAKKRLKRPDGKRFLKQWIAMNQFNLWRFDSAPIFRLRDKTGKLKKLINISAKTLAPMLDYFGDIPEGNAAAFVQFIEGVPWDWLKASDIVYEPFWPQTEGPYGTPPLETILVNANTDVRLQLYFLQFFTAGSVPEAFAIAPEGMTTGDDIADFEEQYYDYFQGDQSERWGLHWLPNGTELQFYKPQMFDPELAEYVARRTISAHGLTPQNLGILDDVNRAASDTQDDQQFRISTLPIVGYYEDLFDSVLQEDWDLPVEVRFDTGREKVDRLMDAQAHQIYVAIGAESSDEVREKVLGLPINPEERVPRFWDSARLGPVPLEWLMSVAGDVDPLTGAPKPGTVTPREFVMVGQQEPDPIAPDKPEQPHGRGKTTDRTPASQGGGAGPKAPGVPVTAAREKVYQRVGRPSAVNKALPTDGQTAEQRTPQALASGSPDGAPGYGMGLGGSTGQGTGVLVDPIADEEAERDDLKKWRKQTLKRVAAGRSPRLFEDAAIPDEVVGAVWSLLKHARCRDDVDFAFKAAEPKAAGIAMQAEDTGRVLLIQRTPDKHDPDEAYARWEFPGGKVDGKENSWEAAAREWSEETGADLPDYEMQGTWLSPDGVYRGFVVTVPSEDSVDLDPDPEECANARWWGKGDLDAPEVRDKVTDTLHLVTPMLKAWAEQVRGGHGRWSTKPEVTRLRFHRDTDAIIDHFTPLIQEAMAQVIPPEIIREALEAAYSSVEKATPQQQPTATNPPASTAPSPAQLAAVAAGTAGLVGAGAVAGAVAAGMARILLMLGTATLRVAVLTRVLALLYAAGYLTGAKEGAAASDGYTPPWLATVGTGDGWSPEQAQQALNMAQGGLAELLDELGIWIKEMTTTQVNRVGEAIQQSVQNGRPLSEAIAAIDAIVHDTARARLIAETEYARAMGLSAMETYRANGVPMLQWIKHAGACPQCVENAAASPQPTDHPVWPNGPIPVHPHERCVVAPYYPPARTKG